MRTVDDNAAEPMMTSYLDEKTAGATTQLLLSPIPYNPTKIIQTDSIELTRYYPISTTQKLSETKKADSEEEWPRLSRPLILVFSLPSP